MHSQSQNVSESSYLFWEWDGKIMIVVLGLIGLFGWILFQGAQVESMRLQEERVQIQQIVP